MKLEHALKALRDGKRIFREGNGLALHFDPIAGNVIECFCLEIFDLLSDDWEIEK
jgi:hypothetical protein